MSNLWERIAHAAESDEYLYVPIGQGPAFEAGRTYMRIYIAEMFLESRLAWFKTLYPVVHVSTRLAFGDRGATITRVVRPPEDVTVTGVLRNHLMMPLTPYNGGTVELQAALMALQGTNVLSTAIDVLQDFSSLVGPPLGLALEASEKVSRGLESLLEAANGQARLAYCDTFGGARQAGSELRPGYLAIVRADMGNPKGRVEPERLSIHEGQLYYRMSPTSDARPFREADYVLLYVDQTRTRDDYRRLTNVQQSYDGILDALEEGNREAADAAALVVREAVNHSADLTHLDRQRVWLALEKQLDYDKGQSEYAAVGVPRQDLDDIVRAWGTPMEQADEVPERLSELPKRYANAALADEGVERVLDRDESLAPDQVVRLRLDIGPLSDESGVTNPEAIPEHLLPRTGLWLEVMVSSTDFAVSEARLDLDGPGIARGRLFLPGDGSPAQTAEGERYLYLWLRAPGDTGQARARVGYYYKAHLVQSQLLTAGVGPGEGGWRVEIDYTLSESLAGLERLPERHQVSIVTNDNGDGSHQIIVRAADGTGALLAKPCTYELDSATVGELVQDLRSRLSSRSPTRQARRRSQLVEDLLVLAPLGHRLFHTVVGPHVQEVYTPLVEHPEAVIQVTRPSSAGYVFPWGLMYEITLELDARGRLNRNAARICPVVEAWDEVSDMVAQGLRQCPAVDDGVHETNTLCPFGFWGYRYPIEQLSSTSSAVREIRVPAGDRFEVAAAETQHGVDLDELAAHIQELREILQDRFPAADVAEGKDRAQVQTLLGQDLPVVYFYCHGERPFVGSSETYLGVGQRQQITAMDFQNWVKDWLVRDRKRVWNRVRPLIFINACHSVEISPDTLVSYLDAFVGAGHAAGVIGTEVKVDQRLAMSVATRFFEQFFGGKTVDQALQAVRLDLLAHGNLFGLAYTPYCWADLHVIAT